MAAVTQNRSTRLFQCPQQPEGRTIDWLRGVKDKMAELIRGQKDRGAAQRHTQTVHLTQTAQTQTSVVSSTTGWLKEERRAYLGERLGPDTWVCSHLM